MPKITPIPYQTLVRVFEKDGFQLQRTRGDHLVYTKPGIPRPLVIPPKMGPSALSRQLPVPADSLTLPLSQRERVGVRVFMVKGEAPRFMNIPMYDQVPVFIIRNNLRSARMSRERYFELLGTV